MTRLRPDQACLEAQMQQQIAQGLNAELAVPCPDCGVESGRACRGDFNREVRTHLARSVAANRRDTEPCPAPSRLEQIQELNAAQESLTRAAARAFAENMRDEFDRAFKSAPGIAPMLWLETAQTGGDFFAVDQTPAASERAPAIAPEAVAFYGPSITEMLPRPTCVCGQTVWKDTAEINGAPACSDCAMSTDFLFWKGPPAPLDKRIAETKGDDATECAWSTPTSEGEGWR